MLGRLDVEQPRLEADWHELLKQAIRATGTVVDSSNPRHKAALADQCAALERITSRKFGVLVGKAGTGKTSVLGALANCAELKARGVTFLAPTGKARVRIQMATGMDAMTVAQFLLRVDRYDAARQRPLLDSAKRFGGTGTVVIDESSMLTIVELWAVLNALDQSRVQRVILVGDPNQLPPIGPGRPFADLAAYLQDIQGAREAKRRARHNALGELSVEVRTVEDKQSDTLRLANLFTSGPKPKDADRILHELVREDCPLNDLDLGFWNTAAELHELILKGMQEHCGLRDAGDVERFNELLGFHGKQMDLSTPAAVEAHQVLCPVRAHPYGVRALNRFMQDSFRQRELNGARRSWGTKLGDGEIVHMDKVIQIRNQTRAAYDWQTKRSDKVYVANGEVGVVATDKSKHLNVCFSGRPYLTFGYSSRDFSDSSGPLDLAYALTIHKAQGSDFGVVFFVLPKDTPLLSRELLYTGLTRSRARLVLLIEGDSIAPLERLCMPEHSETARRNANTFYPTVRDTYKGNPHSRYLIHRAEQGELVQSKSELVIANLLFKEGLEYEYSKPILGRTDSSSVKPDFRFHDPSGEPILWEHLGMMDREDYRRGWEWKLGWYERNGFTLGENLFTSEERGGGLDSMVLAEIAEQIKDKIEGDVEL